MAVELRRGLSTQVGVEPSSQRTSESYRWSSRYVDRSKVHGLDDKVLSMERLLFRRDCPFTAIGIFGMAGVGKTTLCQLIFNNSKVKEYFLPRIWVCMSKQPNEDGHHRKEILKRMLMCLGVEDEIINDADARHGLPGLVFALRLQLTGKRYLIVLDDVENCDEKLDSGLTQDEESVEQLAFGLPKGCGGAVMVTSRAEEVAKNMVGEENLHYLQPLSDSESKICWLIFRDSVEKDGVKFPPDLDQEILKDEIVKKCGGLPLSAKLMGQIMHEQLRKSSEASGNQQESQPPTSS